MLRTSRGGRAGRPRTRAVACSVATLSLLLLPAVAHGEIRTGIATPGTMSPANPSTKIAGGLVTYDSGGKLQVTVRLAAPTAQRDTPEISVVAWVGVYRDGRCRAAPGSPIGQVSGLPDTFSLPPFPDPNFYYLTQIKLAALGADVIGGENVTVSLTGENVNMTATTGVFADKAWNCAWFDVSDAGDGARERGFPDLDRTAPFPLVGPGAGVGLSGRSLRVRGGRVQVGLSNSGAAARGAITVRSGRTTLAKGTYAIDMLSGKRVTLKLSRAGRAALGRARGVRATVTVTATGGRRTTARVVVRR